MAQLVKHLTLEFGMGHDHTVHETELCVRFCIDSAVPAWDSLSPSLPLSSLLLSVYISFYINPGINSIYSVTYTEKNGTSLGFVV